MIEKYLKISLLLLLCISTPLRAQEGSRAWQVLAKQREEYRQQKMEECKKNFPTKENPMPLAVRELIAKKRGISVEELDQASVGRNQKNIKEVVEKGISFIGVFFLIIAVSFLILIRKSIKKRIHNKNKSKTIKNNWGLT